jgi:hypothetical protein
MAAEDVALALMALDDEEVRRRVSVGDFDPVGELELTPEEEELVSAATAVLPRGHATKVLVPFEAAEVAAHALRPGEDSSYWEPGKARAIGYVHEGLRDPGVQARFRAWQKAIPDEVP